MTQPIACTLTPDARAARGDALAALAARALRSRERTDAGERLTFVGDADIERELRAVIAAERSCCSFLAFDLERSGDRVTLAISGPPEARPVIAELFA
jgi:hypothetical protein